MNLVDSLQQLELTPDTLVRLSYEDYDEVSHYTDDYREEVLANTDIVAELTSILLKFGEEVYYYGSSLLQQLRDVGHIDAYEGDDIFGEQLQEVLCENYCDFIEFTTVKYDHKRGRCTVGATVDIPIGRLLSEVHTLPGWKASVKTPHGILIIGCGLKQGETHYEHI